MPQPTTTGDENEAENEAHDENKVQEEEKKKKEDEGVARFFRLSRRGRKAGQARPDQAVCGHVCRQRRERERETRRKRERERVAGLATDRALSIALRIHY